MYRHQELPNAVQTINYITKIILCHQVSLSQVFPIHTSSNLWS